MSDYLFQESRGSAGLGYSETINRPRNRFFVGDGIKGKDKVQMYPISALPHTTERINRFNNWLYKHDLEKLTNLYLYANSLKGDENEKAHLRKFLCDLEAYKRIETRIENVNSIAFNCIHLGPKYAEDLKESRHYYLRTAWDVHPLSAVPDKYKQLKKCSYSDIFNERFLIHWKEEVDDIQYMDLPKKPISEYDQELFKEKLMELLEDIEIEPVEPDNILLKVSTSSSFDPDNEEKKSSKVWKQILDPKKENFSTGNRIIGKRAVIQVGPANSRDAVVLPIGIRNSLSLIAEEAKQITEKLRYSAMVNNLDRRTDMVNRFWKKYTFFFNRDLKKEGLTKPREILKLIQEVLVERYPLCHFDLMNLYENFTLYDELGNEKIKINPPRGHGLGLANELTTIMQSVIFAITADNVFRKYGIEIDALFYNDDSIIGALDDDLANLFLISSEEKKVFERYSLIRNEKKSFWARNFVFLENYYTQIDCKFWCEKRILDLHQAFIGFAACNVTHAKFLFNSISHMYSEVEEVLKDLVSFWGHEFYKNEHNYPYSCGGWIDEYRNGLNYSLINIFDIEDIYELEFLYPGIEGSRVKDVDLYLKRKNTGSIKLQSFYENQYGFKAVDEDDPDLIPLYDSFILIKDYGTVEQKLSRSILDPEIYALYWKRLKELRFKTFRETPKVFNKFKIALRLKEVSSASLALPKEFVKTQGLSNEYIGTRDFDCTTAETSNALLKYIMALIKLNKLNSSVYWDLPASDYPLLVARARKRFIPQEEWNIIYKWDFPICKFKEVAEYSLNFLPVETDYNSLLQFSMNVYNVLRDYYSREKEFPFTLIEELKSELCFKSNAGYPLTSKEFFYIKKYNLNFDQVDLCKMNNLTLDDTLYLLDWEDLSPVEEDEVEVEEEAEEETPAEVNEFEDLELPEGFQEFIKIKTYWDLDTYLGYQDYYFPIYENHLISWLVWKVKDLTTYMTRGSFLTSIKWAPNIEQINIFKLAIKHKVITLKELSEMFDVNLFLSKEEQAHPEFKENTPPAQDDEEGFNLFGEDEGYENPPDAEEEAPAEEDDTGFGMFDEEQPEEQEYAEEEAEDQTLPSGDYDDDYVDLVEEE